MAASLKAFLQSWHLNRAVFYAVAARGWQFLAGPVTVVLIARYFTAETQGWYYTLASLLALQNLADLGLSTTLIHASSHHWGPLRLGPDGIEGEAPALAQLAGLSAISQRWFAALTLAFAVFAGGGGIVFLAQREASLDWRSPWLAAVLCSAGSLAMTPKLAILEGCGEVAAVNRQRFVQAIAANLCVWTLIAIGGGLWTVVAAAGVRTLADAILVFGIYKRFWRSLSTAPDAAAFSWMDRVWPLQWRAAIQSISVYLAYQTFVPVLFHFHGPVVAGQFGMTWSVLVAVQAAAFAWVQTRTGEFGVLASQKRYGDLDRLFRSVTLTSGFLLLIMLCVIGFGVQLLTMAAGAPELPPPVHLAAMRLSERILPLAPTAILAWGVLMIHVPQSQTVYLRSHLRDPLLWPALVTNGIVAGGILWAGATWGAIGVAFAYASVATLLIAPVWMGLWLHCRRTWHQPVAQ